MMKCEHFAFYQLIVLTPEITGFGEVREILACKYAEVTTDMLDYGIVSDFHHL